jgi:hypothetical protein
LKKGSQSGSIYFDLEPRLAEHLAKGALFSTLS